MFRVLATLAFLVSFDMLLFNGRYTLAVEQVTLSMFQHF